MSKNLSIVKVILVAFKYKNSKTTAQSNTNYLPIKKTTEKEMEYQGKTYKYDTQQDIWTPYLGSDDATYHA